MKTIDVLMITHQRPKYTELSLRRLLETCDEWMRVWIWHNGEHEETLALVRGFLSHPRVFEFHHSPDNKGLNEPTKWLWRRAEGDYLSKVDDDCLVPRGWPRILREAHEDVPEFGVIACWHFPLEDFDRELCGPKLKSFPGDHRLLQNCWVGGSGYLMKRACLLENGLLQDRETFTDYCIRLAAKGWINGWYYPFLEQEHMDDPRSLHTLIKSDEDLRRWGPLFAVNRGAKDLAAWKAQLRSDASWVQRAPIDPRYYLGWRRTFRRIMTILKRIFGC